VQPAASGAESRADRDSDMDAVFRALGDPSRRRLLDRLYERDGQTLGELCEAIAEMSRFGVMKHLAVLEDAHLVVTEKHGRSKHHYLNPVPIRRIHDRWISKYAEPFAGALADLSRLTDLPEGA
jgi:DNA-binding transcriptional ArsR family regulator